MARERKSKKPDVQERKEDAQTTQGRLFPPLNPIIVENAQQLMRCLKRSELAKINTASTESVRYFLKWLPNQESCFLKTLTFTEKRLIIQHAEMLNYLDLPSSSFLKILRHKNSLLIFKLQEVFLTIKEIGKSIPIQPEGTGFKV